MLQVATLLEINALRWGIRYSDPLVAQLGMGRLLSQIVGHLQAAAERALLELVSPEEAQAEMASAEAAAARAAADAWRPGAIGEKTSASTMAGAPSAGGPGGQAATVPKLVLLSGHDSTIVPLLSALGLFDNAWPTYAAYLRIELGIALSEPPPPPSEPGEEPASRLHLRMLYNEQPLPLAVAIAAYRSHASSRAEQAGTQTAADQSAAEKDGGWVRSPQQPLV